MKLVIEHLEKELEREELIKNHIKHEMRRMADGVKTSPFPTQNPEYSEQLQEAIQILKTFQFNKSNDKKWQYGITKR